MNIKEGYVFMINTDSYAGNFEREMTAHCTGEVGDDDNTGVEFIPKKIPLDFESIIQQCSDDNGTYRPTQCCGKDAGSVGIFFNEKPSEEHITYMKHQSFTFVDRKRQSPHSWDKDFKLKILGFSGMQVTPSQIIETL